MSVLTRYHIEQKNPNMLPRRILRSNTVNNAPFPKNNDLFKVVENKKLDFELLEYNLKDMESNLCKLMDNTDTSDLSLIDDMYYYGMLPRSQTSVTKDRNKTLEQYLSANNYTNNNNNNNSSSASNFSRRIQPNRKAKNSPMMSNVDLKINDYNNNKHDNMRSHVFGLQDNKSCGTNYDQCMPKSDYFEQMLSPYSENQNNIYSLLNGDSSDYTNILSPAASSLSGSLTASPIMLNDLSCDIDKGMLSQSNSSYASPIANMANFNDFGNQRSMNAARNNNNGHNNNGRNYCFNARKSVKMTVPSNKRQVLEEEFRKEKYPSNEKLQKLSAKLNMRYDEVQNYFKKRRKEEKETNHKFSNLVKLLNNYLEEDEY